MGNLCAPEDKTKLNTMADQLARRKQEITQLQLERNKYEKQHAEQVVELTTLRNYRSVVSNAEGLADAAIADDTINHPLLDDSEERAYLIRAIAFVHARALDMSSARDSTCTL